VSNLSVDESYTSGDCETTRFLDRTIFRDIAMSSQSWLVKTPLYLALMWDSLITSFTLLIANLLPKLTPPFVNLDGKVAIVTGANSGIGFAIAEALAKRNATVYLACRNTSKGQEAATQIIDACGEGSSKRVHVLELDTSSMASVRNFAERWPQRPQNDQVSAIDARHDVCDLLIWMYAAYRPPIP